MNGAQPKERLRVAAPVVIAVAVLAAFWPALGNQFVDWDDAYMIVNNPAYRGFGREHLRWMFSTFLMGHYQPLAWVTLALDHALWGMEPRGYHLTSLVLHVANALLVYALAGALYRLRGAAAPAHVPLAAAVAALAFGLHPLRVESVAWVTERRDVLSAFFLLLTVLAWLRWQAPDRARAGWYAASLACFALSLLSKAWGMTLPVVLLVLDGWPLGRLFRGGERHAPLGRLAVEKLPFIALALAAAVTALYAVHSSGAMVETGTLSVLQRGMQAAYGLCFYLRKTLLPVGLSPVYLLDWALDPWKPAYLASAAGVLVVSALLWALRRRWPAGVAAFLCYAVVVAPVLGFTQSGLQIAADRYAYLSCIPFALLAGAGFARLARGPLPTAAVTTAAVAVFVALGALTWRQTHVWRDSLTFWNHLVALDRDHWVAYNMRGYYHLGRGEADRAVADFDAAIRLNPTYAMSYSNRGLVRAAKGDVAGALADWTRALEVDARLFEARFNRGLVRLGRGDLPGAIEDLGEAASIRPASHVSWYHLAEAQARSGQRSGSLASYRQALATAPADWQQRARVEALLRATAP